MPRDERKRQKALMKKRSKEKAAAQSRARHIAMTPFSEQSLIRRAREFPLLECRISANWQNEQPGLVQVLVARQQPDSNICFGFYLVDKLCLGLKNSLAHAGVPPSDYRRDIREGLYRDTKSKDCPPELAHQMIYQAIDYAQQFGFSPEKDFALNQNVLEPVANWMSRTTSPLAGMASPFLLQVRTIMSIVFSGNWRKRLAPAIMTL